MPSVVLPFHDPRGLYLPHLLAARPRLKQLFSAEFLFLPPGQPALPPEAEPFDLPGVRLSHRGGRRARSRAAPVRRG